MKNPGPRAEELVEQALEILVRDPESPVVHYIHSPSGGWMDGQKIDFFIHFWSRLALPLQIKSGKNTAKEIRAHYRKCPHVLAIRIKIGHTPEKISRQIGILIIRHLKRPIENRLYRNNHEDPAP